MIKSNRFFLNSNNNNNCNPTILTKSSVENPNSIAIGSIEERAVWLSPSKPVADGHGSRIRLLRSTTTTFIFRVLIVTLILSAFIQPTVAEGRIPLTSAALRKKPRPKPKPKPPQPKKVPKIEALPNGKRCHQNLDCASGCCLIRINFYRSFSFRRVYGLCASQALSGQIGIVTVCGVDSLEKSYRDWRLYQLYRNGNAYFNSPHLASSALTAHDLLLENPYLPAASAGSRLTTEQQFDFDQMEQNPFFAQALVTGNGPLGLGMGGGGPIGGGSQRSHLSSYNDRLPPPWMMDGSSLPPGITIPPSTHPFGPPDGPWMNNADPWLMDNNFGNGMGGMGRMSGGGRSGMPSVDLLRDRVTFPFKMPTINGRVPPPWITEVMAAKNGNNNNNYNNNWGNNNNNNNNNNWGNNNNYGGMNNNNNNNNGYGNGGWKSKKHKEKA